MDDATPEPDEPDDATVREENVKHLELIQGVVTRLGNSSMLIKGWGLTLAAATYGFSVNRTDWRITVIGIFTVAGFWFLDTYYLRQERLFRLLYDHARSDIRAVPRFSMSAVRYLGRDIVQYRSVAFSITLGVFYGSLLLAGAVVVVVTAIVQP